MSDCFLPEVFEIKGVAELLHLVVVFLLVSHSVQLQHSEDS